MFYPGSGATGQRSAGGGGAAPLSLVTGDGGVTPGHVTLVTHDTGPVHHIIVIKLNYHTPVLHHSQVWTLASYKIFAM